MIWLLIACNKGPSIEQVGTVDPTPLAYGRGRKRMNIDQVAASIERVTGQSWQELDESGAQVQLFEDLSGSLGKPDYLAATEEDLAPGLLFQKFLDDAARSTCIAAAESERPSQGSYLMLEEEPQDNVRSLILRFHGHEWPANDERVDPWLDLYSVAETPERGWALVCVGLITHPDFYTY